MKTETTINTSLRQALKTIRADLEGRDYLSGPLHYESSKGTLVVTNRASTDGQGVSYLLGVFIAELVGSNGMPVRMYRV